MVEKNKYLLYFKNKKELISIVILSAILFGVYTYYLKQIYYPYIVDSFGYWSGAALLTGRNWSAMMKYVPYYSYGYGILLAPFFLLCKTPIFMYRLALMMNALLMLGCFWLGIDILKKLFPDFKKVYVIIISFASVCYTSYITLSATGLSECLLAFLCLLHIKIMLKLIQKPSMVTMLFLIVLNIYTYMVHQRMLAIIIATAIIILLLGIEKKISMKQLVLYFAVFSVLFMMNNKFKTGFKSSLWLNPAVIIADVNDYSYQIQKLKHLFDFSTIKTIIKQSCGQIFYVGASTFFVAYIAIVSFFKNGFLVLKNMIYKTKIDEIQKHDRALIQLYSLLIFGGLTLISIIYYSMGIGRIDQTVYGRYMEPSFVLLLLFGFAEILQLKRVRLSYGLLVPFLILLGVLTQHRIQYLDSDTFSIGSAAGISYYYKLLDWNMIEIAIAISVMFLFFLLISRKFKTFASLLFIVGITIAFLYMGEIGVREYDVHRQKVARKDMSIINLIKQDTGNQPIYFIDTLDTGTTRYVNFIQFMLPDNSVKLVGTDKLLEESSKYVIVLKKANEEYRPLLEGGYNEVKSSKSYVLYIAKGQKLDK